MRQGMNCALVLLFTCSISYTIASVFTGVLPKAIAIWLVLEGLFYVHRIYLLHKLNATNHPLPEDDVQQRLAQFRTLVGVVDMKEFLSGWFMNAPFELLRRTEVLDLFAFGFWYRDRSTMTEVEQQMVSDTLEDMERRFSFKIPEGTNPDLQFMAHLWQPLRVSHKPLFVHAISEVSVVFTHVILLYMGFQRQHISSFTYWTKHMAAPAPEPRLTKTSSFAARMATADANVLDPIGDALKFAGPGASPECCRQDAEHWKRLQSAIARTATVAQSGVGYLLSAAGGGVGSLLDSQHPPGSLAAGGGGPTAEESSVEAWSVWRRTYPGRRRAALLHAVGGVPLPSASEMQTLFGGMEKAPRHMHPRAASPRTPGRSPRATSPRAPIHKNSPKAVEPVVFLHGVGFGLLPYLGFVQKLLRTFKGEPMIVPEAKTVDELTRGIAQVMARHEVKAAHFVAHSFGTFVVAHTTHLYPDLVKSTLLCDPLLHNFIYKEPETAFGLLRKPLDLFKRAIARDLIIAEAFCRRFWWHTLMLWPDELPPATILSLSHQDELVPCELVQRQMQRDLRPEGHGGGDMMPRALEVVVSPGEHGAFVMKPSLQDHLLQQYQLAINHVYPPYR